MKQTDMKRTWIVIGMVALFCSILFSLYRNPSSETAGENLTPWDQQAYVWQRVWTPQHQDALLQSHELFSGLRVLGLQLNRDEGLRKIAVDTQMLRQDGRPVWLVVRLDGQLQHIDSSLVFENLLSQLHQWQQSGLSVTGVEIDYDSPSSKLVVYQQFLKLLRTRLPQDLQLSLTLLPTWLDSPYLPALVQQADLSVLQVHAVLSPEKGLFDAELAASWIKRYSKVTQKPFYVALPAYGIGLTGFQDQQPVVESESSLYIAGQMQEISVQPQTMADFLSRLKLQHTPHLKGLIWFRLPLEGDRRAWSMPTLKAVILQQPLTVQWIVDAQPQPAEPGQTDALYNLVLRNKGQIDGVMPKEITISSDRCQIADAVGNYRLDSGDQPLRFIRIHSQQLRASRSQAIGWARCTLLVQGDIHVAP